MSREELSRAVDQFLELRGNSLDVRPKKLLFSYEAAELVNMLECLEEVKVVGSETGLGAVFSSAVAAVYRFVPVGTEDEVGLGRIDPGVSWELKLELSKIRNALQPELVMQACADIEVAEGRKGKRTVNKVRKRDWRPLVHEIIQASPLLPAVLDVFAPWDKILPPALESASGIPVAEFKRAVVAFARRVAEENPSTWTDAEVRAADRLVRSSFEHQRVLLRALIVLENSGKLVTSAATLPSIVGISVLVGLALLAKVAFDVIPTIPSMNEHGPDNALPLYALKY